MADAKNHRIQTLRLTAEGTLNPVAKVMNGIPPPHHHTPLTYHTHTHTTPHTTTTSRALAHCLRWGA